MSRAVDPRCACLRVADWPEAERRRWEALTAPPEERRFSERGPATHLSPASLEKYASGYGRWLGFLRYQGWLDPAARPGERVTQERLAAFFDLLVELGNRAHTIAGRFDELRRALQFLEPGRDFSFVTHPGGRSLREVLDLTCRHQEIHHPADLLAWGVELMEGALSRSPRRRQVQLRDGLLIAIQAFRGLRLRSVMSMALGERVRRDETTGLWRLELEAEDVKNGRYISAQLPLLLGHWIDRYVEVERAELLGGNQSDAFWINWGGEPLGEVGFDKRIRWQSGKRFGEDRAFGTHRFRHCIATAAPLLAPEQPGLAAALLRITGRVVADHYDRGDAVLAFKAYHKTLAEERRRTATLAQIPGQLRLNLDGEDAGPVPSGPSAESP